MNKVHDFLSNICCLLVDSPPPPPLGPPTRAMQFALYFGAKDRKDASFYYSFYLSSEELISIDQSVQMYFTVFGFVKLYSAKMCLPLRSFFLNSVTFGVI